MSDSELYDDTLDDFTEDKFNIDDTDRVIDLPDNDSSDNDSEFSQTTYLNGMFKNWFLDYASYVILERAVPEIPDGLKTVQRRILHSMYELEDGRYNKVANIIGNTMKYHPHGDRSIGDALVQLGQKDLLIDTQGNWGNILTGDEAAAPRYIEARLTKFALDVVFNPKTTKWKLTYDSRNKEPIDLPIKFPVLLAQGAEGIAVGLASKILPHNFNELIDASIAVLKNQEFELYPDFPTGGMADVSRYNDGLRGGRVRIRAKITQRDKRTLAITEIPFGTTTSSLIDSIISANDKGKIKIKKIDDNTANKAEILIHLQPAVSPDQTIDALYAFTNCEKSESPNSCVVKDLKPEFIGVSEMLRLSVQRTQFLLELELKIRMNELMETILFQSLEKIFIENEIYYKIKNCETWESVIKTIDTELNPYKPQFYRKITTDDIVKLTEIQIKRISKYNSFKADEATKNLQNELDSVKFNLENIVEYTIDFYKKIKKKYGQNQERKTELRSFDSIEATAVAAATQKLYVNREEGFAGTGLKKDEFVSDCSSIDDMIVFREDGTFTVTKVNEKVFVGTNIIHIDVFKRNDDRTIYNMVYQDGKNGNAYIKRFAIMGVIRDRDYDLTRGTPNSKVLYFTANPNGEAETIKVNLRPKPRIKKLAFEYDFSTLDVKGRTAQGNILTKHAVRKINQIEKGVSTLSARSIWYDEITLRLNSEERGTYLGDFKEDDKIVTINSNGELKVLGFGLETHFEDNLVIIQKLETQRPITVLYKTKGKNAIYAKRFILENKDQKFQTMPNENDCEFILACTDTFPILNLVFDKKDLEPEQINISSTVDITGFKAKGKRITSHITKKIEWLEPLPEPEIVAEDDENEAEDDNENMPENDEQKENVIVETTKETEKNDNKHNNISGSQMSLFD